MALIRCMAGAVRVQANRKIVEDNKKKAAVVG